LLVGRLFGNFAQELAALLPEMQAFSSSLSLRQILQFNQGVYEHLGISQSVGMCDEGSRGDEQFTKDNALPKNITM
jgi:hypothetical protein